MKPNIQVYHFTKACEGGMGQRRAIFLLKEAGIKAEPAHSIYVAHTAVMVYGGKRIQARAFRILYERYR